MIISVVDFLFILKLDYSIQAQTIFFIFMWT